MSLTMHDASVPQFNRALKSLKGVLAKAEAHATAKKIDPAALLTARLYPDMFHTAQQVGTATTMVHWGCAMLAGQERPTLPPVEATFAALNARVQAAVDFAAGYGPDKLNGSEDKPVQLVFPGRTMNFTGKTFLFEFILPNLYFHTAMTYGILRHNGVELGKGDFLAPG
jgi:hypothetical protein